MHFLLRPWKICGDRVVRIKTNNNKQQTCPHRPLLSREKSTGGGFNRLVCVGPGCSHYNIPEQLHVGGVGFDVLVCVGEVSGAVAGCSSFVVVVDVVGGVGWILEFLFARASELKATSYVNRERLERHQVIKWLYNRC